METRNQSDKKQQYDWLFPSKNRFSSSFRKDAIFLGSLYPKETFFQLVRLLIIFGDIIKKFERSDRHRWQSRVLFFNLTTPVL